MPCKVNYEITKVRRVLKVPGLHFSRIWWRASTGSHPRWGRDAPGSGENDVSNAAALPYMAQRCTPCDTLHCTELHCTVLYCTVLDWYIYIYISAGTVLYSLQFSSLLTAHIGPDQVTTSYLMNQELQLEICMFYFLYIRVDVFKYRKKIMVFLILI